MNDLWVSGFLDSVYKRYHRPEFIHPDPLELVRVFADADDREVAGLAVSSLSFGRVECILKAGSGLLALLGPSPSRAIDELPEAELERRFKGFSYRIFSGGDISSFLVGIKRARKKHGSMKNLFLTGLPPRETSIVGPAQSFVEGIRSLSPPFKAHLLPSPGNRSACKRLFLYLRWMVRQDMIDPGGWGEVPAKLLLVPMDTHMAFAAERLGFISGRQGPCLKTALAATEGFRRFAPEDPVRWDFSLTRLGIRRDIDREDVFKTLSHLPPE